MYKNFERLLVQNNITPYRVAKEAGVTQTALSNWKTGRSTPKTKTLQKIADYFNVTVDYLLGDEDSREPDIDNNIDLDKRLNELLGDLINNDTVYFSGEAIDDTSKRLLINSLEKDLESLKIITKK